MLVAKPNNAVFIAEDAFTSMTGMMAESTAITLALLSSEKLSALAATTLSKTLVRNMFVSISTLAPVSSNSASNTCASELK